MKMIEESRRMQALKLAIRSAPHGFDHDDRITDRAERLLAWVKDAPSEA
jgi:hypothetical protein